MDITPTQALETLAALVNDDRLRFLNKREMVVMDLSVATLRDALTPVEPELTDMGLRGPALDESVLEPASVNGEG